MKKFILLTIILLSLSGCAVIAVADAAVTTVATGAKIVVKTTGAVVDAVIPDSDQEKKK